MFLAGWLLYRSRRSGLARALSERATAEAAASLAFAVIGAQLLVAAFLVPAIDGDWFAARYLAPALPIAAAPSPGGSATRRDRSPPRSPPCRSGASAWVLLD